MVWCAQLCARGPYRAELPQGSSERWVVVVVESCSSCISSPFCAGHCLCLPQQVLLCLWYTGDALHS